MVRVSFSKLIRHWPIGVLSLPSMINYTYYRQDLPEGQLAGIVFTHGPIFEFFAQQRRHVEPIKVKFGMEERLLHAKFHLDRSRDGGLRPQN